VDDPVDDGPIAQVGHDTSDSGGSGDGGTAPAWLSWEGEDVLTIDVFADGVVECVFTWRSSGIHQIDACEACTFDFKVTTAPDIDASSCMGGVGALEARWLLDGVFFVEGDRFDDAGLTDSTFEARRYVLDIDPVYGAPVASTWEVQATLR